MNDSYSEIVKNNRQALKSIIATVEICGRQGISLRGHRDDSHYIAEVSNNPGNFLTLLQFRAQGGGTNLADFMKKAQHIALKLLKMR